MGCATSKLDDLPAVALCRDRCSFLDQAIRQRYSFAESHLAYLQSLQGVGLSLHRFFEHDLDLSAPSPLLNLPTQRKGDPEPSSSSAADSLPTPIHHSHSNSGSHLHFHSDSDSDSEDDDSASESLHHLHSDNPTPLHDPYGGGQMNYMDREAVGGSYPGGGFMNINYMQNKAMPSVSYQQRPMSSETVRMGESSSSSSYYPPYGYDNQNPNSYSHYDYSNYGGGMNGFFGAPPPYAPPSSTLPVGSVASSSRPAPPPPSPPQTSAWDFLYPFESYEKYYPIYTPSRDSREVREEEGIPDLEDDDYQQEVVKEVYVEQKFGDARSVANTNEKVDASDHNGKPNDSESLYQTRPSVSIENDNVDYEVHMVEKKVVDNREKSGDRGNVAGFGAQGGLRGDSDVIIQIQVQFKRASDSGDELAKMLEAGKLPYHRKNSAYQVSSKMLHVITPSVVSSQPSTSRNAKSSSILQKADPTQLDIDNDVEMRSRTLSSTLQKLYLWEKKLYEEVKSEEKMRVDHERKRRKLKHLDERGAESTKVDATRALVRSLSTKIKIAIQVVDKISVKINKLRDEELWPQLNEFIQGFTRMWKSMHECHRSQCQAIGEARRLDAIVSGKHSSDAHLKATLQLGHELLNWTLKFSCWVGAQKGYVRALNNWLLKCLLYVPEETPDGMVPFSPSRIGAPPVFIICNQWSLALERISDKEVIDSMRDFATSVLQLWERDRLEMHQGMAGDRNMDREVKNLEREDQKIQKEIQALEKRIVLVSGDSNNGFVAGQAAVYQSDTSESGSLQVSLLHIFEAMERFSARNLEVYEELLQRIDECRLAGGHANVS